MTIPEIKSREITPRELGERLGISERAVREKAYSRTWPHRRLDKRTIRFTEKDIEEILSSSKVSPLGPLKEESLDQTKNELVALLTRRRAA